MSRLQRLLREYLNQRWFATKTEQRFYFDTPEERTRFVQHLNAANAVYHLYESPSSFKVDVYLNGVNPNSETN